MGLAQNLGTRQPKDMDATARGPLSAPVKGGTRKDGATDTDLWWILLRSYVRRMVWANMEVSMRTS